MNLSSNDLETILTERLEIVKKERLALREVIEVYDGRVKAHRKLLGQTPKETEEQLDKEMIRLEHSHSTTPHQNNTDERMFMRDMEKLRQKKKNLASHNKTQAELDELRAHLTSLRRELSDKETTIDELYNGLKKVKTALKVGCSSFDITDHKLVIEETKVSRIIGKGGGTLKSLENEHNVTIDVDSSGGGVKIIGTSAGIQKALAAIMLIVETSVEEFSLPEEKIICLLMEKAALVNEIQAKYQVRIDVSRAKKLCKITGLTNSVNEAKEVIGHIESLRTDIMIDPAYLPFIIGKGGEKIRALEEQFGVSINLNRENNTIEVNGLKKSVEVAVQDIKALIEDNKEVEEVMKMERHVMFGCLMGANMRAVNREFGVRMEIEGGREDLFQAVKIKGTSQKVTSAKNHVLEVIQLYINESIVLEVAEDYIPLIVGKGGAGIKGLREKYPDANIDIDASMIHVHCKSPETRQNIKLEIDELVKANYTITVDLEEEDIINLKSQKETNLREQLTKKLNLRLIMDKENTSVRLRGTYEDVNLGLKILTEYKRNRTLVQVKLNELDYPMFLRSEGEGKDGLSLARKLEKKYKVEISTNRKTFTYGIRGSPENAENARKEIEGILNGEEDYGSLVISVEDLIFPSIIGKGGSQIRKIEEQFSVHVDTNRSTGQVRLRGENKEKLRAAKKFVLNLIDNTRVTETVRVTSNLETKDRDDVLRNASKLYQVEVATEAKKKSEDEEQIVVLKGTYGLVSAAKVYLQDHFRGTCATLVPVLTDHLGAVHTFRFKALYKKHPAVVAEALVEEKKISLRGVSSAVYEALPDMLKILEGMFPTEIYTQSIDNACARDVLDSDFESKLREHGLNMVYYRTKGFVYLYGDESHLEGGKAYFNKKISEWDAKNVSIVIDEFMFPLLVAKSGAVINGLRKDAPKGVSIDLDRESLRIFIRGSKDAAAVENTKKIIQERISRFAAEHWERKIDGDTIPLLIGKAGGTINKIRAESGATVEIENRELLITVNGEEGQVKIAKEMILKILEEEEKNKITIKTILIPPASVYAVIGAKGTIARDIQSNSGIVRFDIDRGASKCIVKGSEEACVKAFKLINEALENEGFVGMAHEEAPGMPERIFDTKDEETEEEVLPVNRGPKTLVGAPPQLQQKAPVGKLSKSALRRLRRKERALEMGEDDDEEDEDSNDEDEEEEQEPQNYASVVAHPPAPPASSTSEDSLLAIVEASLKRLNPDLPTPVTDLTKMQTTAPGVTTVPVVAPPSIPAATDRTFSVDSTPAKSANVGVIGSPKVVSTGGSPGTLFNFGTENNSGSKPPGVREVTPASASGVGSNGSMQLFNMLLGGNSVSPALSGITPSAPTVQNPPQPSIGASTSLGYVPPNPYYPSSIMSSGSSMALQNHQPSAAPSLPTKVPSVSTSAPKAPVNPAAAILQLPGGYNGLPSYPTSEYSNSTTQQGSGGMTKYSNMPVGNGMTAPHGHIQNQNKPNVISKPDTSAGYFKSKSGFSVRL